MAKFTFIDLFAGIGGIRQGFEAAGGTCVFTSEWDAYAQQTYKANFGDEEIFGDITTVVASSIPDHDVLLAGFPCQPFSIAGVSKKNSMGIAHGFADETQGTLFFDVARILKAKRPHAFMLENVRNLLSHDKGNTFRTILKVLEKDLGYVVKYRIINSHHWVPQKRQRIIIVGFRDSDAFDFDALPWPSPTHKLKSILHTSAEGRVNPKYTLSTKLWEFLQGYAKKHAEAGNGFGCNVVGPNDQARTLSARYYKDGAEILVAQRGKNPRKLTPREAARLMGFPDTFRIPVSDTRAYKQFGNSVVVPMAAHVAQLMLPHILKAKRKRK